MKCAGHCTYYLLPSDTLTCQTEKMDIGVGQLRFKVMILLLTSSTDKCKYFAPERKKLIGSFLKVIQVQLQVKR